MSDGDFVWCALQFWKCISIVWCKRKLSVADIFQVHLFSTLRWEASDVIWTRCVVLKNKPLAFRKDTASYVWTYEWTVLPYILPHGRKQLSQRWSEKVTSFLSAACGFFSLLHFLLSAVEKTFRRSARHDSVYAVEGDGMISLDPASVQRCLLECKPYALSASSCSVFVLAFC